MPLNEALELAGEVPESDMLRLLESAKRNHAQNVVEDAPHRNSTKRRYYIKNAVRLREIERERYWAEREEQG